MSATIHDSRQKERSRGVTGGERHLTANALKDSWPTPEQELLLKAALLKDDAAVAAWTAWQATGDIDRLDASSYRLLPVVYRNLHARGVREPLLEKLKGVYRHTWYKNQLFLRRMAECLRWFHAAGIETLLLKGAPLALLFYRDHGLRPMADLDVMVPPDRAVAALDLLRDRGWVRSDRWPETFHESYVSVGNSVGLKDREGNQCDLHWHLMPECCREEADGEFWRGAVPFFIHDVPALTLNPADHLLHVVAHGLRWDPLPPFRWVADAMEIIRSPTPPDWERLAAQAQRCRLAWPAKEGLAYLREKFRAPIPDAVGKNLRKLAASPIEYFEYRYKTQNPERKALGYLPIHWFNYLRLDAGSGSKYNPLRFARYLQRLCGARSLGGLALYALRRRARRLRRNASAAAAKTAA